MNKITKIIIAIIAIIIVINVIVYSLFSFAMWNFNPEHWGEATRSIFALISFALSFFISATILTNEL